MRLGAGCVGYTLLPGMPHGLEIPFVGVVNGSIAVSAGFCGGNDVAHPCMGIRRRWSDRGQAAPLVTIF